MVTDEKIGLVTVRPGRSVTSWGGIIVEIELRVAGFGGSETFRLPRCRQELSKLSGKLGLAAPDVIAGAHGLEGDAMPVAVGSGGPVTVPAPCLEPWVEAHYARHRIRMRIARYMDGRKKSCSIFLECSRTRVGPCRVIS